MGRTGNLVIANNEKVISLIRQHPLLVNALIQPTSSQEFLKISVHYIAFVPDHDDQDYDKTSAPFYQKFNFIKILPIHKLKLSGYQYEKFDMNFVKWIKWISKKVKAELRIETHLERGDADYEFITWTFNSKPGSTIIEQYTVSHDDGPPDHGEITLYNSGDIFLKEEKTVYLERERTFRKKTYSKSWNINPNKKPSTEIGNYIVKAENKISLFDFMSKEERRKLNGENTKSN